MRCLRFTNLIWLDLTWPELTLQLIHPPHCSLFVSVCRSDVRAVCLSSDGLQAATCSSDGVKIWSTRLHTCLRTCATDYGVSVAFAPGGRYVITGTKEGKLQVIIIPYHTLPYRTVPYIRQIDWISGSPLHEISYTHCGCKTIAMLHKDKIPYSRNSHIQIYVVWDRSSIRLHAIICRPR